MDRAALMKVQDGLLQELQRGIAVGVVIALVIAVLIGANQLAFKSDQVPARWPCQAVGWAISWYSRSKPARIIPYRSSKRGKGGRFTSIAADDTASFVGPDKASIISAIVPFEDRRGQGDS